MLSKIRDVFSKITRASVVDESLVKDIVRDIQRILIQSDVNVSLVQKLSKDLEDKVLKEKLPSGISRKEHLTKVLYDELVEILGGEQYKPRVEPHKILLVGLFGSGKCVHPESLIPLSNGEILTAEEIYDKYSIDTPKEFVDSDEIVDVSNKNILAPSFNPTLLKMEDKKITHLWKLKGKSLLDVYLDKGNDTHVRVTPEHPFFVLRDGTLQKIKAGELTANDFVAIPNIISTNEGTIDLFEALKTLDIDINIKDNKCRILTRDNLKSTCANLPFKRNYCKFTMNLKRGIVPISLLTETTQSFLCIKTKTSNKFIKFPKYLNLELAEFLGYVIGDGHLGKNTVEIVSEDREIINRVVTLAKHLFDIDVKIERDPRTNAMVRLRLMSKTLVTILNDVFSINIGKKGKKLKVPIQIVCSDLNVIKRFLRAYFDCDSSPAYNTRSIELVSESERLIRDINLLLLRFGIVSSISKKIVKDLPYWRLFIGAKHAEIYAQKIGYSIEHKLKRIGEYYSFGLSQGSGKVNMIPLGKLLYTTRLSLGFSIGEIQNTVNSYGQFEKNGSISRESLLKLCKLYKEKKTGFIMDFIKCLNDSRDINQTFSRGAINGSLQSLVNYGLINKEGDTINLTSKALGLMTDFNSQTLLDYLEAIAISDVCWIRVSKVKYISSPEYVFDFTVEDNHSFIADGIIVHNTTTVGKLAKFYSKRGLKVCAVCTDIWRPAAYEQMRQVCERINVPAFGDPDQKDSLKILKESMVKTKGYDVVIVDSAGRDSLNQELLSEIKRLNEHLKPEEKFLVISSDIGQTATKQAEAFDKLLKLTGVIATKADASGKAGGALSACYIAKVPVAFIGTGEKVDDFEVFDSRKFVSKLLGFPDLEALLSKVKEVTEEVEFSPEELLTGEYNLKTFYRQLEATRKMGPLKKVFEMLGMGGLPQEMLDTSEEKLAKYKFIIDSMTPDERENPDVINSSRIKRIAKGSGASEQDVRDLIKQFSAGKKMISKLKKGKMKNMQQMMKKFQGGGFEM